MKEKQVDTSISLKLRTSDDPGVQMGEAIATVINPLVADAFALFVKTKNYHWHMCGSHYRDYHMLLDEQAKQIFCMIDVLAERVRKVGGRTIRSIEHISHLQQLRDDNEVFVEPQEMIQRLLRDNKNYAARIRETHKICDNYNDIATASILENFIDETERRTWFLYEISVN